MARTSIFIPDELYDELQEALQKTNEGRKEGLVKQSQWICTAVRMRLDAEKKRKG